jgi:hypothetical protein
MENKKIRVFTLILLSLLALTGMAMAAASLFLNNAGTISSQQNPYIKDNLLFAGLMVMLAGAILFLKNKDLSIFFESIFKKIIPGIKNEDRLHLSILILIIIAGTVFRIIFLFGPVKLFEASLFTKYISDPSTGNLFPVFSTNNYVLNDLFIWFFNYLLGTKEWVIRFPSLLSGIAAIPAIYLTARYFYDKQTAIIAAAFTAASPIFIIYSINANGTSLVIFLFLVTLTLAKFVKDNGSIFAWLFFIFFCSAGFLASSSFIFAYLFILFWLLISIICKDTVFKRSTLLKKLFISIAATLILSFVMYVPNFTNIGSGGIVNANFVYLSTIKNSSNYLLLNLKYFLEPWNNPVVSFIIIILLPVLIIISLIFHKDIKLKQRVPLSGILILIFLIIILMKTASPYPEVFAFIMLLFIITGAYCLSISAKKIKSKNVLFGEVFFHIFSIIIITIIFSVNIFTNAISNYQKKDTYEYIENIIPDIKEEVKSNNKFLFENDLDYIFKFYLSKHQISKNILSYDFYPEKNIYIFITKSSNTGPGEILKDYCGEQDAGSAGFKNFEHYKDYDSTVVYRAESFDFPETPLIDLNKIKLEAELKNFNPNNLPERLTLKTGDESMISYMKMPVKLKKNTNYLVILDIEYIGFFDNAVNFDFFGNGYDNVAQEHIIKPKQIKASFSRKRFVINSGEVPENTDTFFRIYTNGRGRIIIQNLNLYEISG